MRVLNLHDWQVTTAQAREIQLALAAEVSRKSELGDVRLVLGVDTSIDRFRGTGQAAAVVLSYPELRVVEVQVVCGKLGFPYVPGLLSFREAPMILAACAKLEATPDLVFVDGQGLAHPRRMGIACHIGLLLDKPTIGCAKSRLCGTNEMPAAKARSYTDLLDGDEVIGAIVRTKTGVGPVYVSIGHKVDLATAIKWTLKCCRGFRLPEPARMAHTAAGGNLKVGKELVTCGGKTSK